MNSLLQISDKLRKVRKTTRPFRYDLNQIPYDYTVDVTNTFQGLDLIDRVPEELQVVVAETGRQRDGFVVMVSIFLVVDLHK